MASNESNGQVWGQKGPLEKNRRSVDEIWGKEVRPGEALDVMRSYE